MQRSVWSKQDDTLTKHHFKHPKYGNVSETIQPLICLLAISMVIGTTDES